jgi:hypothetical protein
MDKFYWSHIDIPNYEEIQKDFKDQFHYVKPIIRPGFNVIKEHIMLFSKNKSLTDFFEKNDLIVRTLAIICTRPMDSQEIHIDYLRADFDHLALNFEIFNCKNNFTVMYDSFKSPVFKVDAENKIEFFDFDTDKCVEKTRFNLSKPVLFNTQLPHQVYNLTDEPRISISFRFFDTTKFLKTCLT